AYPHSRRFPGFGEEPQAVLFQTLKVVRRGARFICSAAQHGRPGVMYSPGGFQDLLPAFYRAGTGNHNELVASENYIPHGNRGLFLLQLPPHEFEGLPDGDHALDSRSPFQRLKSGPIVAAPDRADDRAGLSEYRVSNVTVRTDLLADVLDLFPGRSGLHGDDHRSGSSN